MKIVSIMLESYMNMLVAVSNSIEEGGMDVEVREPQPVPLEGFYHPDATDIFADIKDYLEW